MISGTYIIYMRKERPAAGGPRKQMKATNVLTNEVKELSNVDMAPFYRALLQVKKVGVQQSAHINVVPDLDEDVMHFLTPHGYEHILLRYDEPKKMIDRVVAESEKIGSPDLPLSCFDYGLSIPSGNADADITSNNTIHLSGNIIGQLQNLFCILSKHCKVPCPQMVFVPDPYPSCSITYENDADVRAIVLNLNSNILLSTFHEFRYAWQAKYHPDVFNNYIDLETCKERYPRNHSQIYNSQVAEFDANVYAAYFVKRIYFKRFGTEAFVFPDACEALDISESIAGILPPIIAEDVFSSVPMELYKTIYPALIV